MTLNGNVKATDAVRANDGFASGTAALIAAGAEMYEPLAERIPSILAPPMLNPTKVPSNVPKIP